MTKVVGGFLRHQVSKMNTDMKFFGRKVCFIGAHPDDIELGCGALIAHISKTSEVLCVTLSDNQKKPPADESGG